MLIFSNISSSTGTYRVFTKNPFDIHSSTDDDDNNNTNNINNNNKITIQLIGSGLWQDFLQDFFCVLPSSAAQGCKQALACFSIWPRVY